MEQIKKNKRGLNGTDFLFGKIPPQARDLEQAVLGAMMLEKDSIPIVVDILHEDSFYVDAHIKIYTAIIELFNKGDSVDILTVTDRLRFKGEIESVGGVYYIMELTNRVSSGANIEFHSRIIEQRAILRRLITLCLETTRDAYDDTTDAFELLERHESKLYSDVNKIHSGSDATPLRRISKTLEFIQGAVMAKKSGKIVGVPTGIQEFDDEYGGWHKGNLIVIASRPGNGKSALLFQVCMGAKVPVGVFELEMSDTEVGARELAMVSDIPYSRMRTGNLSDDDVSRIVDFSGSIDESKIYVDTGSELNLTTLRSKIRKMIQEYGIQAVFIDYLNLMDYEKEGKYENDDVKIGRTTKGLKVLAKQLNIPIILLAQLNREVEKTPDKKPKQHHLRSSGNIEAHADMIIFLMRPEYYKILTDEDGNSLANRIFVDIAKCKQGLPREFLLGCNIATNKIFSLQEAKQQSQLVDFTEVEKEYEEPLPF